MRSKSITEYREKAHRDLSITSEAFGNMCQTLEKRGVDSGTATYTILSMVLTMMRTLCDPDDYDDIIKSAQNEAEIIGKKLLEDGEECP